MEFVRDYETFKELLSDYSHKINSLDFEKKIVFSTILIISIFLLGYNFTGFFVYGQPLQPTKVSGINLTLEDILYVDDIFVELYFVNKTQFSAEFLTGSKTYLLTLHSETTNSLNVEIELDGEKIYFSELEPTLNLTLNLTEGNNTFDFIFTEISIKEPEKIDLPITGFFIYGENGTEETETVDDYGSAEIETFEESINESESIKEEKETNETKPEENQTETIPELNQTNQTEPINETKPEENQTETIPELNQTNQTEPINETKPEENQTETIPELNQTNQTEPINETKPEENQTETIPELNQTNQTEEVNGTILLKIDFLGLIPLEREPPIEQNLTNQTINITEENFNIDYGEFIQGEIELFSPVEWTQKISVYNPNNFTRYEEINLLLPLDAENISVTREKTFFSDKGVINLSLESEEIVYLEVLFHTAPVTIEIISENLSLFDLLPPEAEDIAVYEDSKELANYEKLSESKLEFSGLRRQIIVYHNSSLHYENISIDLANFEIPLEEELAIKTQEEDISKILSLEDTIFTIPKLSEINLTLGPEAVYLQKEALLDEPVEWTLSIGNLSINYQTPEPRKIETNVSTGKRVIIYSNVSVHYENVKAFTNLSDLYYKPKLYWVVSEQNYSEYSEEYFSEEPEIVYSLLDQGLLKIDVSSEPYFNVTYTDLDEDGKFDLLEWNVPQLSEQEFEVSLIIINVQSYPVVGLDWIVRFNTTGTANLTITAVNGTTWSNFSELSKDANPEGYDLKFLELKCGDEIINYEWTDNSVFVENYSCNETSYETSKVLSGGRHHLKFQFGDIVAYAHNSAIYNGKLCYDGSGATCNVYCTQRVYVCDSNSSCNTSIIMLDRRDSCNDTDGFSSTIESSSCTNWDVPENCLAEGSLPNYFYGWSRINEEGNSTTTYLFSTSDLEADTCESHCTCLVGQGYWNLSGEVSATSCCGDDAGEYRAFSKFGTGMNGTSDLSNACCNADNKCVDNNTCYASASSYDADGDGDNDYCNAGTWTDTS